MLVQAAQVFLACDQSVPDDTPDCIFRSRKMSVFRGPAGGKELIAMCEPEGWKGLRSVDSLAAAAVMIRG